MNRFKSEEDRIAIHIWIVFSPTPRH